MRQYCRYCNNMCCGDANYCTVKQRCYSDKALRQPNRCKDFEFNPVDAMGLNPRGYNPRRPKREPDIGQIKFIEWMP